jgi:hypothetical protein
LSIASQILAIDAILAREIRESFMPSRHITCSRSSGFDKLG